MSVYTNIEKNALKVFYNTFDFTGRFSDPV